MSAPRQLQCISQIFLFCWQWSATVSLPPFYLPVCLHCFIIAEFCDWLAFLKAVHLLGFSGLQLAKINHQWEASYKKLKQRYQTLKTRSRERDSDPTHRRKKGTTRKSSATRTAGASSPRENAREDKQLAPLAMNTGDSASAKTVSSEDSSSDDSEEESSICSLPSAAASDLMKTEKPGTSGMVSSSNQRKPAKTVTAGVSSTNVTAAAGSDSEDNLTDGASTPGSQPPTVLIQSTTVSELQQEIQAYKHQIQELRLHIARLKEAVSFYD